MNKHKNLTDQTKGVLKELGISLNSDFVTTLNGTNTQIARFMDFIAINGSEDIDDFPSANILCNLIIWQLSRLHPTIAPYSCEVMKLKTGEFSFRILISPL